MPTMTLSSLFALFCFFSTFHVLLSNTCTQYTRVTRKKTTTIHERCGSDLCGQVVYKNDTSTRIVNYCCLGWTGRNCDIPVCSNPKCRNNAICSKKDSCFCRTAYSWGTTCIISKCSHYDCFPGTCKTNRGRTCQCSSGFSGSNCLTMRDSPTFTKCQISLLAISGGHKNVVFTGQCNATEKLYSNARYISDIVIEWEITYQTPDDIPSKPVHIQSYEFGIISASVQGSMTSTSHYGRTVSLSRTCKRQLIRASPVAVLNCSDSIRLSATSRQHGDSLQGTFKATSGGQKRVTATYRSVSFIGKSASQTVSVTFDLTAPSHCANGNGGPAVDVGLEMDSSTSPNHRLRWFGWTDADSGLNKFSYKIYPMKTDFTGLLTEKSQPVAAGSQTAYNTTYPTFTLPRPGMYSAILRVTDDAGNVATARGLLLWDSDSTVTVTDRPMTVGGQTSDADGVVWLLIRSYNQLVVNWHKHFENKFHHNNKLLNGVKHWSEGLDDREGNLTVDAIANEHGIVTFVFGYSAVSRTAPVTWIDVGLKHQYKFSPTFPCRIYVKAYDVMGNSATDSLGIGVGIADWTPPTVQYLGLKKNVPFSESKLSFSSRFTLIVDDKESGIKAIHYEVIDSTKDSRLWGGTFTVQLDTKDTYWCDNGNTCVCTTFYGCYHRQHVLYIDHCWLASSTGYNIQVKVVVSNHIGLSTTTFVKLGVVEGLRGMNTCPNYSTATGGLGAGAIVGIIMGVISVVLMGSTVCILILFVLTRRRRHEPYMPHSIADFRQTMRQSVRFNNNATNSPGEFQLSSNRQQQPPLSDAVASDDDVAAWKIPAEKVVLGQRLSNATGRFADILHATVKLANSRQSVVAKKLKHGGNEESKLLMTAKMNFWATSCPKHENILHFIGAILSGPILLFELCELGRLRDWLAAQSQLTDELQDNMITFSLQIAKGMRHLHAQNIIHQRLGARNILLTKDAVGSVTAKIAGFGVMKTEVQTAKNTNAEGKIPVKWMAPEQFKIVVGATRKYDTKTDIWSYGVTLWEIFSKGEIPYPDCTSEEISALLSTGYRMPRPAHCPDIMFDQVVTPCWENSATSRPSFADVVTVIEIIFLNGGAGDEYYVERSEDPAQRDCNGAMYEATLEVSNDHMYEDARTMCYDNKTYEASPECANGDEIYEPTT